MAALPNLARLLEPLRQRAGRVVARRGHRRREVTAFGAEITACRTALLGFGRKSDEEFTALARGLGKLNGRLSELRAQTESLELIIDNRDEDRALDSAYALYKNSVDLVHASAGIAVSAEQQLGSIENVLVAARKIQEKFQRNQLLLNVLAINVRMEAARVGPEHRAVFLNVAADIAEIGAKIRDGMETAFGAIDKVILETRAERADLKDLDHLITCEARRSIVTIQQELDGLKEALAPCAAKSREISGLFANTGPQTMRVISSLQHQDIVRQQLEHVADGFKDMADHLQAVDAIEWVYVRQAGAIQQAQLNAARADISQAGQAVVDGLQGLLNSHATMVDSFVAMDEMAAAALGNCHVAQSFSAKIKELATMVERSESANNRIAQLVAHIREVVEVFTRRVAGNEYELKMVALNAQIAAARLPSAEALNKLSEETSHASDANAEVTRSLVISLRKGMDQLSNVKGETDSFLTIVNKEKGELEIGTVKVREKLAQLMSRVQTGAARVRQEFEPVFRESQALLAAVDFPRLIDASFAPASELCVRLKETAAEFANGDQLSAEAAQRLEQHQKRYTMRQENATHSAALASGAVAPAAGSVTPASDEVELFGDTPTPAAAGAAAAGDIDLFAPEPPPAATESPAAAAPGDIELFDAPPPAPTGSSAPGDIELFASPPPPAPEPAPGATEAASAPAAEKKTEVPMPLAPPPAPKAPAAQPRPAPAEFGDGIELF